jgi:hypothetical protein
VVTATTPTVSATEEAPASSQTRSEVFELVLHGSGFTICLFYQFDTDSPNCYQNLHTEILPKREHFSVFPRELAFSTAFILHQERCNSALFCPQGRFTPSVLRTIRIIFADNLSPSC